ALDPRRGEQRIDAPFEHRARTEHQVLLRQRRADAAPGPRSGDQCHVARRLRRAIGHRNGTCREPRKVRILGLRTESSTTSPAAATPSGPLGDRADALGSIPAPRPGQVRVLPRCHGSGDALLLAALARREATDAARDGSGEADVGQAAAHGRVLAIVTAAPADAARLAQEMSWFAPRLRVLLLPDWETLPYDAFSPHQDLVSERLSTLYALQQ